MNNNDHVIRTYDLTKRFKNLTAVDEINFAVNQGEVFGFLGPNGAGKTTTIAMLLGLVRPTAGSAEVLGIGSLYAARSIRPSPTVVMISNSRGGAGPYCPDPISVGCPLYTVLPYSVHPHCG